MGSAGVKGLDSVEKSDLPLHLLGEVDISEVTVKICAQDVESSLYLVVSSVGITN